MIIFGTRGITTTPEKGDFHCPSCSGTQNYGLKRVRNFFTLYFIPLIPLNKVGEYVECGTCKDTFKEEVLNYSPDKNALQVEAEYHTAVRKVMIHVLLADGVIEDSEVETSLEIYQQITGVELAEYKLRDEILEIEKANESLTVSLNNLQGFLNDEGKELVIKAALLVALSDGDFQQEEQDLIAQIGKDLGMTTAHIQGVLASA